MDNQEPYAPDTGLCAAFAVQCRLFLGQWVPGVFVPAVFVLFVAASIAFSALGQLVGLLGHRFGGRGWLGGLVGLLALIVAACFLGPLLPWLPHPNVQDLSRIAESPSWQHWFGTDQLGRDLLARVLYGGRISLLVGVVATGVSLVIGVTYGLVSGYAGGRLDALMMRLVDVLFALPFIVLVIIFSLSVEEPAQQLTQWVSGVTGWSVEMVSPMTGLIPLFIAIGALGWLTLARIVRTQTCLLYTSPSPRD